MHSGKLSPTWQQSNSARLHLKIEKGWVCGSELGSWVWSPVLHISPPPTHAQMRIDPISVYSTMNLYASLFMKNSQKKLWKYTINSCSETPSGSLNQLELTFVNKLSMQFMWIIEFNFQNNIMQHNMFIWLLVIIKLDHRGIIFMARSRVKTWINSCIENNTKMVEIAKKFQDENTAYYPSWLETSLSKAAF